MKKPAGIDAAHDAASSVAECLEACLFELGIDVLPMLPGGPLMPFLRAIHLKRRIRTVLARREDGVAMMADGYHRATRAFPAIAVTAGPGVTNAVTGVALAYSEHTPLLIISAQVARGLRGRTAAQELDTVRLLSPITKESRELYDPTRACATVKELCEIARQGRRGPVHLSIAADLWEQKAVRQDESPARWIEAPRLPAPHLDSVLDAVSQARAPVLVAGRGVVSSDASDALLRVVNAIPQLRVACTPRAKGCFPESHPRSVGVLGFAGHPSAERAVLVESDLVIVVGSRLGEISTSSWDSRLAERPLVQVDVDASELGRNYAVRYPVLADAGCFLDALARGFDRVRRAAKLSVRRALHVVEREPDPPALRAEPAPSQPACLRPLDVMTRLGDRLGDATHVYVDIGNCMAWAIRGLRRDLPGRFHVNLSFGCMGHALPAAIGGCLGLREPTLAIVGDAAFAMTGTELHTAVEERLPVVVVVMNDSGHGMVEVGSRLVFGDDEVPNVRFSHPIDAAALARSLGAVGEMIRDLDSLGLAVERALARPGPTLLDVIIDPRDVPPFGARADLLRANFAARRRSA